MSGLKGSGISGGYESDESDDEIVGSLIRQIESAPKLISFTEDTKFNISLVRFSNS